MEDIKQAIKSACQKLYQVDLAVELSRPEEQFGDYATNIALQLSATVGKNPRSIAEELAEELRASLGDQISDISVAGPGFINLKLSDQAILASLEQVPDKPLSGQVIVAEYSDPNPFKVLHAGHLYTSVVGDAIANLLQQAGAEVHRVNFGGDVGLHVGKTMWAVINKLGSEEPDKLAEISQDDQANWLAAAYVEGSRAYEQDESAKAQIIQLNKQVYKLHEDDDHSSPFAQIYWICRQWSYDYFNKFYARIGSGFEKYYPESQTAAIGLKAVRAHIGDVYEESNGAVIFDGEKYGLHKRVFINSEGLPTYEAKDVGLIMLKKQDYDFDRSIVITGNEQVQYMEVVLKSIEQFAPELSQKTNHLTHGLVKLQGGVKMSSRKGNFLRAVDVLEAAAEANRQLIHEDNPDTVLGAVKYAFLKKSMGGDIIYDPQESVSLEGNSGPYLQYAHARARSIIGKAEASSNLSDVLDWDLQPGERSLVRKLAEYYQVNQKAVSELTPHYICTYLYELSQVFNRFYEHNRVIGDQRQALRLALVARYADNLREGLSILGIASPDKL